MFKLISYPIPLLFAADVQLPGKECESEPEPPEQSESQLNLSFSPRTFRLLGWENAAINHN